jgi:hypothetical protein
LGEEDYKDNDKSQYHFGECIQVEKDEGDEAHDCGQSEDGYYRTARVLRPTKVSVGRKMKDAIVLWYGKKEYEGYDEGDGSGWYTLVGGEMKDKDGDVIEWKPPTEERAAAAATLAPTPTPEGGYIKMGNYKITGTEPSPWFSASECLDHWTIKPWFSQQKQGFNGKIEAAKKARALGPAYGMYKLDLERELRRLGVADLDFKKAKVAALVARYLEELKWDPDSTDSSADVGECDEGECEEGGDGE